MRIVIHYLLVVAAVVSNTQLFAAETFKHDQPEWRYSVRPGDNLIYISRQHLINPGDWRLLQKINQIKNPFRIPPGTVLRLPLHLVKQVATPAMVVAVNGKAGILKTDKSVTLVTLGQQLTAGTELVTSEKSTLKIKFADGSIVSMQPNSTLKLDTLSMYSGGGMVDTKLRLQQGKLEATANPAHVNDNKMQIVTPTAVAAVRGTKFRLSAMDASVTQETIDGRVALTAADKEVLVSRGYGSVSKDGKSPSPPILLLSAPSLEALPTQLDTIPIKFDMPKQNGAVAWLGMISTEPVFDSISAETTSQGAQLRFDDLSDGNYFLKVRAKDDKGLEGYDAVHRFVLNARPFAPIASMPTQASTVREANPELSWAQVEQINEYLIEVARDADFKQLLDSRRVMTTTYKIEKSLDPGQYYWRLASIDATEQGPYTAINSFIYKPKPDAPDISQLKVHVHNNRVFVSTVSAQNGLSYKVALHNETNQQKNVWETINTSGEFSFLLKEYGKQTLSLRLVDTEGTSGPEAIYDFNASPQ
jgi:hypothetical protein